MNKSGSYSTRRVLLPYLEALLTDPAVDYPGNRSVILEHEYTMYVRPGIQARPHVSQRRNTVQSLVLLHREGRQDLFDTQGFGPCQVE